MTPFLKFIKSGLERTFGKYYEGPEAPDRIRKMVAAFAAEHPRATRQEWIDFACEHACEAYKSGYVRGFEYVERDPDMFRKDLPPEVIADMLDPNWRWGDEVDPFTGDVREVVPDERIEEEEVQRNMEEAREMYAREGRNPWARSM